MDLAQHSTNKSMDNQRRRKTPTGPAQDGLDGNSFMESTGERPSKAQKTKGGRKYVQKNSLEEKQLLEERDRARAVLKDKKEHEITQDDIMAEKRASNRLSAFLSRKRRKLIIEDLQKTVAELSTHNDEKATTIETLKTELKEQRELKTAILRELSPLRSSQGDLPVALSQPIAARPEESQSMYRASTTETTTHQSYANPPAPRITQSEMRRTEKIDDTLMKQNYEMNGLSSSSPQEDGAISTVIQFLASQAGNMSPENWGIVQAFLEKDAQDSSSKPALQGAPLHHSNTAPTQVATFNTSHQQEQRQDPPPTYTQYLPDNQVQRSLFATHHEESHHPLQPANRKLQGPTQTVGQVSQLPPSQNAQDTQLLDYLRQLIESQESSGMR